MSNTFVLTSQDQNDQIIKDNYAILLTLTNDSLFVRTTNKESYKIYEKLINTYDIINFPYINTINDLHKLLIDGFDDKHSTIILIKEFKNKLQFDIYFDNIIKFNFSFELNDLNSDNNSIQSLVGQVVELQNKLAIESTKFEDLQNKFKVLESRCNTQFTNGVIEIGYFLYWNNENSNSCNSIFCHRNVTKLDIHIEGLTFKDRNDNYYQKINRNVFQCVINEYNVRIPMNKLYLQNISHLECLENLCITSFIDPINTIENNSLKHLILFGQITTNIKCPKLETLTLKCSSLTKISDKIQHLTNVKIIIQRCTNLNTDLDLLKMKNVSFQ